MYISVVFGLLFYSVMAKTGTVGVTIRKGLRLYSKFVPRSERRRLMYYVSMFSFSCHGFVLWLLLHTLCKESSKTKSNKLVKKLKSNGVTKNSNSNIIFKESIRRNTLLFIALCTNNDIIVVHPAYMRPDPGNIHKWWNKIKKSKAIDLMIFLKEA